MPPAPKASAWPKAPRGDSHIPAKSGVTTGSASAWPKAPESTQVPWKTSAPFRFGGTSTNSWNSPPGSVAETASLASSSLDFSLNSAKSPPQWGTVSSDPKPSWPAPTGVSTLKNPSHSNATVVTATTLSTNPSLQTAHSETSTVSSLTEMSFVTQPPPALEPTFAQTQLPPLPPPPPNVWSNIPAMPNKTSGVPKAALYTLFSRAPRRKVLNESDYYTWHNGGPPHELWWTAIFLCPITGKSFPSLLMNSDCKKDEAGIAWHKKKTWASHGAAARAWNHFTRLDTPLHLPVARLGEEEGEGFDQPLELPDACVPENIRKAISSARAKMQSQMQNEQESSTKSGQTTQPLEDDNMDEGEVAWRLPTFP